MLKSISLILCICFAPSSPSALTFTSKFDEFHFRDCEFLIARLDNFAVAINDYKQAVGVIYVYEGKVARNSEGQHYVDVIRNYLIQRRKVDSTRLRVLLGGYQEKAGAEIWIVPPGATSPDPSPSLDRKNVTFKKVPIPKKKNRCARGPWK